MEEIRVFPIGEVGFARRPSFRRSQGDPDKSLSQVRSKHCCKHNSIAQLNTSEFGLWQLLHVGSSRVSSSGFEVENPVEGGKRGVGGGRGGRAGRQLRASSGYKKPGCQTRPRHCDEY